MQIIFDKDKRHVAGAGMVSQKVPNMLLSAVFSLLSQTMYLF